MQIRLLILITLSTLYVSAKDLRFTHITADNGLAHNLVFDIAQDKSGFIWMGTNNGLCRYDGYGFKYYRPGNENSISDKSIYSIYPDSKGYLWITIQGQGLNRMHLSSEKLSYFIPNNDTTCSLKGNFVYHIYEDSTNILWVATNAGVHYFDDSTETFANILPDSINLQTYPNYNCYNIIGRYGDDLWFLTQNGIARYNIETKTLASLSQLTNRPEFNIEHFMTTATTDSKGNIYFAVEFQGLFRYNVHSGKLSNPNTKYDQLINFYCKNDSLLYTYSNLPYNELVEFNIKNENISINKTYPIFGKKALTHLSYSKDKNENLWVSSAAGLAMVDSYGNFTMQKAAPYIDNGLRDDYIHKSFIDSDDNLWLSIFRKGIDVAHLYQLPFENYFENPYKTQSSICGNSVTMVFEDSRGKVWVGCFDKGLSCYNPETGTYKTIETDANDYSKILYSAPSAMIEDSDGMLWVGFYDGQMAKINPETFELEYYSKYSKHKLLIWSIREFAFDNEGDLWIASTSHGVVERITNTGEFIYHSVEHEENFNLNNNYRTLIITKDGNVWTGTQNGGLGLYVVNEKKWKHYLHKPDDENSIPCNTVYSVYEESDSILWVGTAAGLCRFNRNTEVFQHVNYSGDKIGCSVYKIKADDNNNFWLSGDCGLMRYNRLNEEITLFTQQDGITFNQFNTTAACKAKDGKIYMGSSKGLTAFYPDKIVNNQKKLTPKVTGLKAFNIEVTPGKSVNGHILLEKQIWENDEIEIPYNINDFTLEFSGLEYSSPNKILYEYKMEGFNDKWIQSNSTRRWANFTGLLPGKYIFKLRAANSPNVIFNENDEYNLTIRILPPFYMTTWFIILSLIFIAGIIVLVFWVRTRRLRKNNETLERKVNLRTRELSESNTLLSEKEKEVSLQNKELNKHRNHLEQLIEERTKELIIAKEKAEESDRLKTSFVTNLSHEIRTPMNAIVGFSTLLEPGMEADTQKFYISYINKNCESLLVLINDLMDISLVQANQMEIKKRTFNITAILKEFKKFYPEKAEEGVNILSDFPDEEVNIFNDEVRFRQVFTNLLNNAVKFTHKGHVEFGYFCDEEKFTFFVKDTGIGIPEKEHSRIFSPFTKIEQDNNVMYSGTGIGLSISKTLAELMGGSMWFESECYIGTSFYFTLPNNSKDK